MRVRVWVAMAAAVMMAGASVVARGKDDPAAVVQAPAVLDLEKAAAQRPLGEKLVRMDELDRTEHASVHLVQLAAGGEVAPNYHKERDELVLVWKGAGKLTVGDVVTDLRAGQSALIRKGAVHSFKAEQATVAMVVFTPAFDGKDRHSPAGK